MGNLNKMSGVLARAAGGSLGRQSWAQLPKVSGCVIVQHRDASDTPAKFKLSAMKKGTGGRSSFSGIVATVFGSTGFLGRYVCNRLGKVGSQIIIPYRCDPYDLERLRMCGDLGQVLFLPFELQDEESIRKVLQYSNVAINLIGRDYETPNFSYKSVHVDGARRIAKEMGVEKFIHMSHLNAQPNLQRIWGESKFLASKYESELAVREEFPEATIFKPSDMYGEDDRFLNYYKHRGRWSYVPNWSVPLWKGGEQTIKQPVFVSDVAEGIMKVVQSSGMEGKDIECVGPTRYYLKDIVEYILRILRRDEYMTVNNAVLINRIRTAIIENTLSRRSPRRRGYANLDRLEREHHTDWTSASNPTLDDLGISQADFTIMAHFFLHPYRRDAYYTEQMGEFADPEPPKNAEFYHDRPSPAPLP